MLLFHPEERSEAEVVLLLGAGAVEDSWNPVLKALEGRVPSPTKDAPNVYFATLVYRLRWLHGMSVAQGISVDARRSYSSALGEALNEYQSVTTGIAQCIQDWDGNKLRPEAALLSQRLLRPRSERFHIASTNWDFSAGDLLDDSADGGGSVDYIHGTYDVGLYLPGEIVAEPYRGPANLSEFNASSRRTVLALRDASRLILYGLSVSPLDGELGFILQSAHGQRRAPFEEVIIVDPYHQAVVANLRVHLGAQRYLCVDPRDLADFELPNGS